MKQNATNRFKSVAPAALVLAALALVGSAWNAGFRGSAGDGTSVVSTGQGGFLEDLARPQDGRSMRATSAMRVDELRRGPDGDKNAGPRKYNPKGDFRGDASEQSNWDNFNVPPGATHVLLDEQGPGVITHIWMTFLGPEPQNWAKQGSAHHGEMMLRMYWDGSTRPAVEAPLGDFFASCFGKRSEVISLPVIVANGTAYNSFWHMPFQKSARIEIENQSNKPLSMLYYNIDWIKKDKLSKDTPYFYAQYRQEYPAQHGKDYLLLETAGKGHYVGTVLAVRTRSPAWWGEGDEKIYIDGETKPSIWGTGSEDYFLCAWGLRKTNMPYFGVPFFTQLGIGGLTSAYRWHLEDPMVFNTGIKVTMEHMGWISQDENPEYKATSWNEREDDFASVAFWYQTGTSTFTARAPAMAERRYPSLDRVIFYARDFADAANHGEGAVLKQQSNFFDGQHLIYRPTQAAGAWLQIPIEVKKKEPLRLLISAAKTPDSGRYQASLNGVRVGRPIDLYGDRPDSQEFELLDFWPDPGAYTLRLECIGKNAQSDGFAFGLESARLRERRPRVAEYGHDKNKDWKLAPGLAR